MNTGHTITDLEALVSRHLPQLEGQVQPPNPQPAPLFCECGDEATHVTRNFQLCDYCYDEYRRGYM